MAQKYFGTNVPISSGFDINSQRPLDPRTVVETYSDLENIPNIQLYPGLEVYVEDEETKYYYNGSEWKNVSTQGPKGDKGDQGEQGPAATINIGTVTTGAAGTEASVTNSGTQGSAILNFVIPRGDKGDETIGAIDQEARDRITNLASLSEGSTTGDAELIDIRVGVDGVIYDSAGESIRNQIKEIDEKIDNIELDDGSITISKLSSDIVTIDDSIPYNYEVITIYESDTNTESELYRIADYIELVCYSHYALYDETMDEIYNGWGSWQSTYPKYSNAVYVKAFLGKINVLIKTRNQKKIMLPGKYDSIYRLKKYKYYLNTGEEYTFSIISGKSYYIYIPTNSISITEVSYLGITNQYNTNITQELIFNENIKEIKIVSYVVNNNCYIEGYFYEKELTNPSLKLIEENIDTDFCTILRQKNGVDSRLSNVIYLGELIKNPTGVDYMAWPLGCVKYDDIDDNVVIICSCNKTHTTTDEYSGSYIVKVNCKTMIATDPIRLQDGDGNYLHNISGFCILSDNTYLAIANYTLYKSTDKGIIWDLIGDLSNSTGETIESLINPISSYRNMEILSNGRIIVGAWSQTEVFSLISDDNGKTWEATSMGSIASGNQEPCFCELDNGIIFSIIRKTMSAKYTKTNGYMTEPAIMCYSTDYGNTWEQWWESISIPELSGTPAYIFNHKNEKQIEAFWVSRKECNVYHASASYDGALKDGFSKPELIRPTVDQFGKTGVGGDLSSDSGYITGCYDKYGRMHIIYYDVMDSDTTNRKTTYKYMIATRNNMSLLVDNEVSPITTWSSTKIEEELQKVRDMIN